MTQELMRHHINIQEKKINLWLISFFLSTLFGAYFINIGFSFKLFMLLSLLYILVNNVKIKFYKLQNYEIVLMIFFIYYSSTGVFSDFPETSIRLIIVLIIVLAFYFLLKDLLGKYSIPVIERNISVAGIVFNVISLLLYLAGMIAANFNFAYNGISYYGLLLDRGTPRMIGTFSDPNIFAFGNFLFFFYYLTHLKHKNSKTGLILSLFSLVLTFSRGAYIALLIAFVFYYIFSSAKSKILIPIITSFFIVLIITLSNWLWKFDVIEIIRNRFSTLSTDGGSGRIDIWLNGLSFFENNPIFGIGIYNYKSYSEYFFGINHYMHNTFLEVLVESGLIGFILYALFFAMLFVQMLLNLKNVKFQYLFLTFVSMVVMMNSLSLVANEVLFLFLALYWRYDYEARKLKN